MICFKILVFSLLLCLLVPKVSANNFAYESIELKDHETINKPGIIFGIDPTSRRQSAKAFLDMQVGLHLRDGKRLVKPLVALCSKVFLRQQLATWESIKMQSSAMELGVDRVVPCLRKLNGINAGQHTEL